MAGGRYADPATGAFGGASYGATKRDDRDSDRDRDGDDADKDGKKRRRRKEGEEGRRRRWGAALRTQNEDPTHRRVGKNKRKPNSPTSFV